MTPNCQTFFKKKFKKSVTIWEHLPKRYYFWTIIEQKKEKSVTIWGHGLYYMYIVYSIYYNFSYFSKKLKNLQF